MYNFSKNKGFIMKDLQIGDEAPKFTLLNQDGIEISLKDFVGKKVVLYFYPKDDTPGCTIESCEFSELGDEFSAKNAVVIGISPDDSKSHCKFIDKFKLKQILLCDTQTQTARAYGAWGLKKNYGREYEGILRSTFIIDEQGKIAKIFRNVNPREQHGKVVLESL